MLAVLKNDRMRDTDRKVEIEKLLNKVRVCIEPTLAVYPGV